MRVVMLTTLDRSNLPSEMPPLIVAKSNQAGAKNRCSGIAKEFLTIKSSTLQVPTRSTNLTLSCHPGGYSPVILQKGDETYIRGTISSKGIVEVDSNGNGFISPNISVTLKTSPQFVAKPVNVRLTLRPNDLSGNAAWPDGPLEWEIADRVKDVSQDARWAKAVGFLAVSTGKENVIIPGCPAGSFCPNRSMSRSDIALWLWRAEGSEEPTTLGSALFNDVKSSSVADKAIGWLAEENITQGCTEKKFCPEETVSRGQLATFLYRAFKPPDAGRFTTTIFKDVPKGSFSHAAVAWLENSNISPQGCNAPDGPKFCPDDPATRVLAAEWVYGFYMRIEWLQYFANY